LTSAFANRLYRDIESEAYAWVDTLPRHILGTFATESASIHLLSTAYALHRWSSKKPRFLRWKFLFGMKHWNLVNDRIMRDIGALTTGRYRDSLFDVQAEVGFWIWHLGGRKITAEAAMANESLSYQTKFVGIVYMADNPGVVSFWDAGFREHDEIRRFVDNGIDVELALSMVTTDSA